LLLAIDWQPHAPEQKVTQPRQCSVQSSAAVAALSLPQKRNVADEQTQQKTQASFFRLIAA
jgi:hypothetical protein